MNKISTTIIISTTLISLACLPAQAGFVKKGVDGTKKGVHTGVDGTKKGVGTAIGGTKKGVRTSVDGTKKFFKKIF